MLFIFSIIIIFLSIKSKRIYETIYDIQKGIISNISTISFSDIIKGTKNYVYKIESKNVYFKHFAINLNNYKNTIEFSKPQILVSLQLSIYEDNTTDIFDLKSNYKKDEIIIDKAMANINFESINYFQQYEDFSFNMSSKIKDINNDISINFHKLRDIFLFNNLFYNETSKLYNNKTLYEYSKEIILKNLLKEMNNNLIYYPECDALVIFKELYDYFLNKEFTFFVPCDGFYYNKGQVYKFAYEKIIKQNTSIILKNIRIVLYYMESDYESSEIEYEYVRAFELDEITINENYKISFPYLTEYDSDHCLLKIFEEIIMKSKNYYEQ